jgi:hypothetical protein
MGFYSLGKDQRKTLVNEINREISKYLINENPERVLKYFSNEDTYIRKAAYIAVGKIYRNNTENRVKIIFRLNDIFRSSNEKVRQTVINSAGEIGMNDFIAIEPLIEKGLYDEHHSVRNAVIGSLKKMGERNSKPVLLFANRFLHHENEEIRREICHGIELFGRTHPEDILPLLKELRNDKSARVKKTLIHVLGQISYKKGCLEKVIAHLINWDNEQFFKKAAKEILVVHKRYENFSALTFEQAQNYIRKYSKFDI